MGEKGDKLREAAELADQEEALQEQRKRITDELKRSGYQSSQSLVILILRRSSQRSID